MSKIIQNYAVYLLVYLSVFPFLICVLYVGRSMERMGPSCIIHNDVVCKSTCGCKLCASGKCVNSAYNCHGNYTSSSVNCANSMWLINDIGDSVSIITMSIMIIIPVFITTSALIRYLQLVNLIPTQN